MERQHHFRFAKLGWKMVRVVSSKMSLLGCLTEIVQGMFMYCAVDSVLAFHGFPVSLIDQAVIPNMQLS